MLKRPCFAHQDLTTFAYALLASLLMLGGCASDEPSDTTDEECAEDDADCADDDAEPSDDDSDPDDDAEPADDDADDGEGGSGGEPMEAEPEPMMAAGGEGGSDTGDTMAGAGGSPSSLDAGTDRDDDPEAAAGAGGEGTGGSSSNGGGSGGAEAAGGEASTVEPVECIVEPVGELDEVDFELPPACDGDGEPNETAAFACTQPLSEDVTGRILAADTDVTDCHSFPVQAGVTHALTIQKVSGPTGVSGGDDMVYDVTTASGIVLLEPVRISDNAALYHELPVDTSEAATLCITAGSATSQYEYAFRVDPDWVHGLVQDAVTLEPNNTPATGYPLCVGGEMESLFTVSEADFVDCYHFEAVAGIRYSLTLEKVSGPTGVSGGDDMVYDVVTDEGIELLPPTRISGNAALYHEMQADITENANLCIAAGAVAEQYTYAFRLDEDWQNGLIQDPTTFEPNNTPSVAYPVDMGSTWSSRFTTSQADYTDCFRLDVEAGATQTLSVEKVSGPSGVSGGDDMVYDLVTASGVILVEATRISGNSALNHEFTPDTTELATLCLVAGDHGSQYEYTFRFD